jgi:GNAT superfamily N-acetyltransferase
MIALLRAEDLVELLPLMRAYADFYAVHPSDAALLRMSGALIADPVHEGVQLIARDPDGSAIGFATVFWTWSTLSASRLGVLNDLFVTPDARGRGTGEALIQAALAQCRRHGAAQLSWQTARDNARAQALYDRLGAHREEWLDYWLPS